MNIRRKKMSKIDEFKSKKSLEENRAKKVLSIEQKIKEFKFS